MAQSPEELKAEIEQTRQDLADTVEALTAKLDVKSRAKDRISATKDQAAARLARIAHAPFPAPGGEVQRG